MDLSHILFVLSVRFNLQKIKKDLLPIVVIMETDSLAFTCNWANIRGTPLATDWDYHGMSGLPVTTEENPEGRRTLRNNASRTHRLLSRDELENGKQARWLELEVHGKSHFRNLNFFDLGKVRNLNGFFEMRHLTALFASNNSIQKISPKISQLSNLTLLDLSFNQIALLPSEIGDMGSLTHLNISNNQLKSLPAEMGKLFRLKSLSKFKLYHAFKPFSRHFEQSFAE